MGCDFSIRNTATIQDFLCAKISGLGKTLCRAVISLYACLYNFNVGCNTENYPLHDKEGDCHFLDFSVGIAGGSRMIVVSQSQ